MATLNNFAPKTSKDIKPVSHHLARPAKKIAVKFGFHDPNFLKHWPEYVGEEIARIAYPRQLKPRRNNGAILILDCESGYASELKMRSEEIQTRVNSAIGFAAVGRVDIRHQVAGFAQERRPYESTPVCHTKAKAPAELDRLVNSSHSDELRQSLAKLMQYYYQNRS